MCSDHCWHSPVYTYLYADNHKSQQLLTRTIEDCTRSVLCKRPMLMLTRVFVQVPRYCFSRFVQVPGYFISRFVQVPGYCFSRSVQVPGYCFCRFIQVPGYCFSRFVQVPWRYCVHYKTKDTHAQCADNCWHRPEWTVTRVIAANSVTPTFPPRLLFPRTPFHCVQSAVPGGGSYVMRNSGGVTYPAWGKGGLQGWLEVASKQFADQYPRMGITNCKTTLLFASSIFS